MHPDLAQTPLVPPLPEDDAELLARAGVSASTGQGGLFENCDWIRRVSREPALLFGGGRALLLEVAHPLVAAGVAQHSQFRTDPFGRLQRTLDAMSAITFGDREAALAAARSVERAHARVAGLLSSATARLPAGTPYHGRQPDLMHWVWATLVDTSVAVYELFVAALPPGAVEEFYAQQRVLAMLLGIPPAELPPSWSAFRANFEAIVAGDRLEVTPEAREIADAVMSMAGPGPVRAITAALLPERLRAGFGLAWDEARAERFAGLVRSVRSLREEGSVDGSPGPR